VLLDHVGDFVSSLSDHAGDGFGSLGLHLKEVLKVFVDHSNVLARHLSLVGLELLRAVVHLTHDLLNLAELGRGGNSAFLGLASRSFGFHALHPGVTVGFDRSAKSFFGLLLGFPDDDFSGLLHVSDVSLLLPHELSHLALRFSLGFPDSSGHRHDNDLHLHHRDLALTSHSKLFGLHSLEFVKAGSEGSDFSFAFLSLASFHSSSQVLSLSGNLGLSSLVDSGEHGLASFHNFRHGLLVSNVHLLVSSGSLSLSFFIFGGGEGR